MTRSRGFAIACCLAIAAISSAVAGCTGFSLNPESSGPAAQYKPPSVVAATTGTQTAVSSAAAQPRKTGTAVGNKTKTTAGKKSSKAKRGGTSRSKGASAGPVAVIANDAGFRLYARGLLREQMQSAVNISKLAAGKITRFTMDSGAVSGNTWTGSIHAYFSDGTSAPGVLKMARFNGAWFISKITGARTGAASGEAGTVSTGLGGDVVASGSVDESVVGIIISQLKANQPAAREVVAGTTSEISITGVDRGLGTSTLSAVVRFKSGKTEKATIGLIRKGKYWYIVRLTYS